MVGAAQRAERAARTDLVPYMGAARRDGPIWAPDQLSIWPVEGGRFGIDAHYHGASGRDRAPPAGGRLGRVNLPVAVREEDDGGATLRLGPLAHQAAWLAIEAFLGRTLDRHRGRLADGVGHVGEAVALEQRDEALEQLLDDPGPW
jgi:hypothetical protein